MAMKNIVRRVTVGSCLLGALAAPACSSSGSAVGSGGSGIDTGQCLGESTKCSPPLEGDRLAALESQECDLTPAGTFTSTFASEAMPYSAEQIEAAADGSAWVLGRESVYGPGVEDHTTIWARHYDANGALLGQNDNVAEAGPHTTLTTSIGIGPQGSAVVYVYSVFAATADDDLTEQVSFLRLGSDGSALGPATNLAGISTGRVAVGSAGSVTIAANASGNATIGRLVRIANDGAPVFVQSSVPTNGQGIGTGMNGLLLQAQGSSTILSERSRTFQSQITTFGIAAYDSAGSLTNNWLLPTAFVSGYGAELAKRPGGALAVLGQVSDADHVVLGYSATGDPEFAWQVPMASGLRVDAASGATVVGSGGGLVVISADGAECRFYARSGQNTVAAGSVSFSDGWTLTRSDLEPE
jgi:hypothetical protein